MTSFFDGSTQVEVSEPHSSDVLFFEPWIGKRHSEGFAGRRVLLLGESHYLDGEGYEPRTFTTGVIQRWAITGPTAPYFTRICRLILGGAIPSLVERTAFWNSVVFYNYVQAWVGTGPRQRPTPANWATGEVGLRSVMTAYSPQVMIVLGADLWWHVARTLAPTPGKFVGTFSSGTTTIAAVHHPSAGFSYARWKPVVDAAFAGKHSAGVGTGPS
jgi:hypothetical protein